MGRGMARTASVSFDMGLLLSVIPLPLHAAVFLRVFLPPFPEAFKRFRVDSGFVRPVIALRPFARLTLPLLLHLPHGLERLGQGDEGLIGIAVVGEEAFDSRVK